MENSRFVPNDIKIELVFPSLVTHASQPPTATANAIKLEYEIPFI